jgi:chorismate mutase
LTDIAARLEAFEESIIFRLADRVQYKLNSAIYSQKTFLNYMYKSVEQILDESKTIAAKENLCQDALKDINLIENIKERYLDLLNIICEKGDDDEYSATSQADIEVMVAVSKRIHYGSFYVAESKFLSNSKNYIEAVKTGKEAVIELLTRRDKEEKIIARVTKKLDKIQAIYTSKFRKKIVAKTIGNFYKDTIIPFTKEGEATYLLRRCKNEI